MCAIFGFNFDDKELLKKMSIALSHRGPDGEGYFTDGSFSLGHRRLKIIDLTDNAKQPMQNEDASIWLSYNGEIYNFLELKKELEQKHEFISNTDSEVIIHSYEEHGLGFIKKLRGMFAFALYDADKKRIILARDRIGKKPLYYHFDGESIIFASEIKGILQQVKPEIDLEALDEFFTFQFSIAPRTLFKNIKKVMPGEMLVFDMADKSLRSEIYWNVDLRHENYSEDYCIDFLERLIEDSVKARLISDVPLGVYLSGGLDSSYVAAVAKELKNDIKTFTVAFNHESDETGHAKRVAECIDAEHEEIEVSADMKELLPAVTWHLDTPAADVAAVPTYIIARETKKHITVALTGDGGDELFGGYEKYKIMLLRDLPLAKLALCFYMLKLNEERKERARQMLADEKSAYLAYASAFSDKEKMQLYMGAQIFNQKEKIGKFLDLKAPLLQKMLYLDLKTLLPDDYLMKVDKTAMASAIETRVPYLDSALVEFSFKIPPAYKIKRGTTKYIFRKLISKKLPREIVEREKHGFNVPTKAWLDRGLKDIAMQMFENFNGSLINREYAKKVLNNFNRDERYYTRQFWSLFSFALWYKMYFEFEKPKFNLDAYI